MAIDLIPLVELGRPVTGLTWDDVQWSPSNDVQLADPFWHGVRCIGHKTSFCYASSLQNEHWLRIIRSHLGETAPEDSAAIFGGFGLSEDGEWRLLPQCCGSLAEIADWKAVAAIEQGQTLYLGEGHPSPGFTLVAENILIDCDDRWEAFHPTTAPQMKFPRHLVADAIDRAERELVLLSQNVNALAPVFGASSLESLFFNHS